MAIIPIVKITLLLSYALELHLIAFCYIVIEFVYVSTKIYIIITAILTILTNCRVCDLL